MKKIITFLLAVVFVFGMCAGASANSSRITNAEKPFTAGNYEDISVTPGRTYTFPLTADMFVWSDGKEGSKDVPVTMSQISDASISVDARYQGKSKDYVKSLKIESKKVSGFGSTNVACVVIEFTDKVKTEALSFDFTAYLTRRGGRISTSEVKFSGKVERPVLDVYDDEEYIDLSHGDIVQSQGYIREIQFHLGDRLFITGRMYEGRQYYGIADTIITSNDEKLLDAYPEIARIYRLDTNITGGTVHFDLDKQYYVYDGDGKYVGTTDESLKQSSAFYLASEKIQMAGSSNTGNSYVDDDDDDAIYGYEEAPTAKQNQGPTETLPPTTPSNINDNPGTGR